MISRSQSQPCATVDRRRSSGPTQSVSSWPPSSPATPAWHQFNRCCRSYSTSFRSLLSSPDGYVPRSRRRRVLHALLGVGISLGLLFWALRGVSLEDVLGHVAAAKPAPLAVAVVLATLTFPLRLLRWHLLLRNEK